MGEIRFVGTGETRRYPYLVCKKVTYSMLFLRNSKNDPSATCIFEIQGQMVQIIVSLTKLLVKDSLS